MQRTKDLLLSIDEPLTVRAGKRRVVVDREAQLRIRSGDLVFLIGPSGTGKTILGKRLASPTAAWWANAGRRPHRVGAIYQEPSSFSDPYTSIGDQLAETAATCASDLDIDRLCADLGFANGMDRLHPNVLSAGQQQRLLIGIQLLRRLDLLIADEPTSALDPVNRFKIIQLLIDALYRRQLQALLFITHDLLAVHLAQSIWHDLAADNAEFPGLCYKLDYLPQDPDQTRLRPYPEALRPESTHPLPLWWPCINYIRALGDGKKIKDKTTLEQNMSALAHTLTGRGLSSLRDLEKTRATDSDEIPPRSRTRSRDSCITLDRRFFYSTPYRSSGIDLSDHPISLETGRMTALIGASGAGKTTLMRVAAGLLKGRRERGWRSLKHLFDDWRRGTAYPGLQIVFQNPDATILNPTQRLDQLLYSLPNCPDLHRQCDLLLPHLGLTQDMLSRYPDTLSGGEQYRAGMLLALLNAPDFLVLDEPFAAVDEANQERIIELCLALKNGTLNAGNYHYREAKPMGILLISHQLEIVFKVCDLWYLLDQPAGVSHSICVWQGRPIDAYRAFRAKEVTTPYLQDLFRLSFENKPPDDSLE